MTARRLISSRRGFLSTLAVGAFALGTRGGLAAELALTPHQTEGPFYPDKLPLDTDNDLIIVNDTLTSAVGEIAHVTGLSESALKTRLHRARHMLAEALGPEEQMLWEAETTPS